LRRPQTIKSFYSLDIGQPPTAHYVARIDSRDDREGLGVANDSGGDNRRVVLNCHFREAPLCKNGAVAGLSCTAETSANALREMPTKFSPESWRRFLGWQSRAFAHEDAKREARLGRALHDRRLVPAFGESWLLPIRSLG
jgi:hypothetical protein